MMVRKGWLMCLSAALCLSAPAIRADVWDQGTTNDNGTQTQNELVHGTSQFHDLAAQSGPTADLDWFKLGQPPYSSWEIVVDSLSANPALQITLELISSNGTTVVKTSVGTSTLGFTRSLRFTNASSSSVNNQYIRIKASCATTCTANDVYQVRAFETTYAISRFNNSGTQSTTLIVQNKSANTITGTLAFWNGSGTLLTTVALGYPGASISAKNSIILNLTSISQLVGQSGSITIASDGRHADLSGKAVAIESATGFTFDTPMDLRPR